MGVTELKYREKSIIQNISIGSAVFLFCPNNRNKGYSSALISRAKKHAADLSINLLYLQCDAEHIASYERYGFNALHEAEHFGDVTTIMVWQMSHQLNTAFKNATEI
jgi:GNAT superfamily N-acetyltransferase